MQVTVADNGQDMSDHAVGYTRTKSIENVIISREGDHSWKTQSLLESMIIGERETVILSSSVAVEIMPCFPKKWMVLLNQT
jgi:hypothetical protein